MSALSKDQERLKEEAKALSITTLIAVGKFTPVDAERAVSTLLRNGIELRERGAVTSTIDPELTQIRMNALSFVLQTSSVMTVDTLVEEASIIEKFITEGVTSKHD